MSVILIKKHVMRFITIEKVQHSNSKINVLASSALLCLRAYFTI